MSETDKISEEEFEKLVSRALESIPEEFQQFMENIVVMIADEPPPGMENVLGLYEGVPLVHRGTGGALFPDRITIFRGPITRVCRTRDRIEAEVRATVLHEIGHFFGMEEWQLH